MSDHLLLITQLNDAGCHLTHSLIVELETEGFEILANIGLTTGLTQSIFTFASKAFGQQFVAVEVILVIAIGMYTCHLSEDIFTYDGLIGRDGDTRVGLYEATHIIKALFVDRGLGTKMVAQDSLHTC